MRGKHRFWLAALAAIATPAMTQESAPPGLFMNQAGIEQTIALLASRIKPDQPIIGQPLIGLGSYRATLEYRQAPSGAAIHEAEAEYFQVVEGSGTLVTGGALQGAHRTGPTQVAGTSIIGGSTRPVTKGDMLIIPEGTPHWFNQINGRLVLIAMKLPRGAKTAP